MDATPVTLGQEFGGYATQIEQSIARLHAVLPRVGELPARRHRGGHRHQRAQDVRPPGRSPASSAAPTCRSPRPRDHFAAQAARDALVEASGAVRTLAVAL